MILILVLVFWHAILTPDDDFPNPTDNRRGSGGSEEELPGVVPRSSQKGRKEGESTRPGSHAMKSAREEVPLDGNIRITDGGELIPISSGGEVYNDMGSRGGSSSIASEHLVPIDSRPGSKASKCDSRRGAKRDSKSSGSSSSRRRSNEEANGNNGWYDPSSLPPASPVDLSGLTREWDVIDNPPIQPRPSQDRLSSRQGGERPMAGTSSSSSQQQSNSNNSNFASKLQPMDLNESRKNRPSPAISPVAEEGKPSFILFDEFRKDSKKGGVAGVKLQSLSGTPEAPGGWMC